MAEFFERTPQAKKRCAVEDTPASNEKSKIRKMEPVTVIGDTSSPSKPPYARRESNAQLRLQAATQVAAQMYEDAWDRFLASRYWHGSDRACELAELHASKVYEEACTAVADLIPWAQMKMCKVLQPGCYTALQFQGRQRPQNDELSLRQELENFRQEGEHGRARDAICALLAVLSARREKAWLDGLEAEERLKNQLKWKRNKQQKLQESIADLMLRKIRGEFARALVDPEANFRVAFARNKCCLRPASLLITYQCPLKEALESMDSDGPLEERPFSWFVKSGREFALQEICTGTGRDDDFSREHTTKITPDHAIKKLLASRKQAVFLDAIAALAPRKQAKEHGLSSIVQWELLTLLREAKSQGQAVVFMLGGKESHKLAEKVYLKPPFTENGLRCGYLRWRESPSHPWAREKLSWYDRMCIGLQLP